MLIHLMFSLVRIIRLSGMGVFSGIFRCQDCTLALDALCLSVIILFSMRVVAVFHLCFLLVRFFRFCYVKFLVSICLLCLCLMFASRCCVASVYCLYDVGVGEAVVGSVRLVVCVSFSVLCVLCACFRPDFEFLVL